MSEHNWPALAASQYDPTLPAAHRTGEWIVETVDGQKVRTFVPADESKAAYDQRVHDLRAAADAEREKE